MGRYRFYECEETGHRFILKDARPRQRGRHHPNQPGKVERIMARRREPATAPSFTPSTVKVAPSTRAEVLSIGHCEFCSSVENLTVDHIVPVSQGGGHHRANLQCLCWLCNYWKDDAIITPADYAKMSNREIRVLIRKAKARNIRRTEYKQRKIF